MTFGRYTPLFSFASLAGVLLFVSTPSPATDTPTVGGGHGRPFRFQCPAGQFLVGVSGRTGSWVDQVRPVCAAWDAGQARLGRPEIRPESFGGWRGKLDAVACPGDSAISGWEIRQTRHESPMVQYFAIECRAMLPPHDVIRVGILRFGIRAGPTRGGRFSAAEAFHGCPPNELAVGMHGAWDLHVDRLGLICGPAPQGPPPRGRLGKRTAK